MNRILILLPFIFLSSCIGIENSNEINGVDTNLTEVEIHVTQTSSYCGGARPTEEILQRLKTPVPFSSKSIYIKPHNNGNWDEPVVASGITNDSGIVIIRLEPGQYVLVDERKQDRSYFNQLLSRYGKPTIDFTAIDTSCLNAWYRTPDASFVVEQGKRQVIKLNYPNPCPWNSVPCAQYTGNYPP